MKSKLILGIILLSSQLATADILFLDMNNAPLEIAAARRAAAARGESVIVIPGPTQRAANRNGFRKEQLDQELQRLKSQRANISSVVISGHDGNGSFSGDLGSIGAEDLRSAFAKAKPVGDNARSLLLWGCYTATPGSIEFRWKDSLPGVVAVAGYDGSAPARERLGSHTYLEDFLKKEKSLLQIRDARQLAAAYNSIRNINVMKAAACVNDTYLQPGKAPRTMQSILGECKDVATNAPAAEQFSCFFESRAGCETLPANTPDSPLRTYYNHLHATSHCDPQLRAAGVRRADPHSVISLILFQNVVANMQKLNAAEIAHLNQTLQETGAPADLRIGDLTTMKRGEIRALLEKVKLHFNSKFDGTKKDTDAEVELEAKRNVAYRMVSGIANSLHQLQERCVPFDWVEPTGRSASSCIPKAANVQADIASGKKRLHESAVYSLHREARSRSESAIEGPELRRANERVRALYSDRTATEVERSRAEQEVDRLRDAQEQILQPRVISELERAAQQPSTSPERRRAIAAHIADLRQSSARARPTPPPTN